MAKTDKPELDARVAATASRLRIDAATAEVVRALSAAGVQSLLLKGPSTARWLYDEHEPRGYNDCDLLTRPDQIEVTKRILTRLGFREYLDDTAMPSWWRTHAGEWWRSDDGVLVDLHRTVPGLGVEPESGWSTLFADADTILVGGEPVRTPALPGRALLVALHAAHHGPEWGGPLADLERALLRADESVWRSAASLAERLGAADGLAAGLRLVTEGVILADRLGLPAGTSVETALRASSPPPVALGFEQLAQAKGVRARVTIIWRKLFPPAEFMRQWSTGYADRPSRLARAYLARPLWLLRHAPEGFRAWRRARGQVRRGDRP